MKCKNCGCDSTFVEQIIQTNGAKHNAVKCAQCKKLQTYIKSVPNSNFIMPYGKYKGMLIKDITKKDLNYAKWTIENSQTNIGNRFTELIKGYEAIASHKNKS